jgi:hypothetical protein
MLAFECDLALPSSSCFPRLWGSHNGAAFFIFVIGFWCRCTSPHLVRDVVHLVAVYAQLGAHGVAWAHFIRMAWRICSKLFTSAMLSSGSCKITTYLNILTYGCVKPSLLSCFSQLRTTLPHWRGLHAWGRRLIYCQRQARIRCLQPKM